MEEVNGGFMQRVAAFLLLNAIASCFDIFNLRSSMALHISLIFEQDGGWSKVLFGKEIMKVS